MQHAPRKHATCNAHRCNTHGAPMQHASMRHVDATYKAMYCSDATRADATRNASRCNMHIAYRTTHPVPNAPGRHRAATWLPHMVCLDACTLPLGNLATRCMTSARASCSARRARAAVQHSASRWGRPLANDSKGVLTRSTPAACAVHRTPLTAACVRRTVRAIHRPCRTAQHTIPRRAGRATRAGHTHAPPCCSRSSRP